MAYSSAISVRLERDLRKRLEVEAKRLDRSEGWVVRQALDTVLPPLPKEKGK